jgi:zinc protease
MTAARPRTALLASALAIALGGGVSLICDSALARAPVAVAAQAQAGVDIAHEQFTLPNGLRVVVHTDRKAPVVAVNIWYHVGSKDEPAGRSGFAHLFEHLMFNGSENHRGEFFEPFKQVGATNQNGTTNTDRTNYFQNVPTTALDMALWMESDRMGHLLGAIDQAVLDEQRGVVQNEKRQGENQPYGQVWDRLNRALYPAGHPYHHSVIGSMNDLNAASVEDVHQWFKTWYGPNNAVLVLAGDIDLATAKEKVARYFGDIPAGPSMAQPRVDVAKRSADTREELTRPGAAGTHLPRLERGPDRHRRCGPAAGAGQRAWRRQILAPGPASGAQRTAGGQHQRRRVRLAAGLQLHRHGHGQAGRGPGQGRGSHRRGDRTPDRRGPQRR